VISVILFDLDGTLLETEELKALSYARAAVELRPDEVREAEVMEAFKDLVGLSRGEVAESLMRRFGLEEQARAHVEEAEGVEEEPWEAYVRLRLRVYEELLEDPELLLKQRYQHNIDLLRGLRSEGYPVCLATMSHRYQVERVLEVLGLAGELDFVATVDDVSKGKPDPEIDLMVSRALGVPPEEFLVVEDSVAGVQAALAAGMAVVAVPTSLTESKFRETQTLESRWVVYEPGTVREVVGQRIEAAGGRAKREDI
jgi:HAD superfamily hydrolase (TIGR01509 family)